jgi:Flp pilus assembly protein TadG
VAPLFFLCFFAAIDAGLWAIQTSAAVSAAEQAARLAASAARTPQSEDTPSPRVLFAAVRNQLGQAMFGTTAIASCQPSGGADGATELGNTWMGVNVAPLLDGAPERRIGPVIGSVSV